MTQIEGHQSKLDAHVHYFGPDAKKNTDAALIKRLKDLRGRGILDGTVLLGHDFFPPAPSLKTIEKESGVFILPGIEISAQSPLGELAHVVGIFPQIPEDWPLAEPQWQTKYPWQKLAVIRSLPSMETAINTIVNRDGIAAIAHPSRVVPILGINQKELEEIHGLFPREVALEVNAAFIYRVEKRWVIRMAKELFSGRLTGGSDAHEPDEISRIITLIPRRSENLFDDFKTGLDLGIVAVNGHHQRLLQWFKLMMLRVKDGKT